MRSTLLTCAAVVVASTWAGCSKDDSGEGPQAVTVPSPADAPPIKVTEADKSLLYRYFPKSGSAKIASSREGVPLDARETVLVIPDGVEVPAGLAYVADLRTPGADGTFPYKVVTQAELDGVLASTRVAQEPRAIAGVTPGPAHGSAPPMHAAGGSTAQTSASSGKNEVIMYSTTWCGVCQQARRWFRNKGIDVVDRDIEADASAQEDMMRRAAEAGLDGSRLTGVPVIWVNGQMFPGFDPGKIQAALRS